MTLRRLALAMTGLLLLVPASRAAEGDAPGALSRLPRTRITAAAAEIDQRIDADLQAIGLKPTPRTTDAVFARRIYLDLIGRIPTGAEASAFLASSDSEKRAALIDHLLESPGYDSHLFNWFADLLRVKSKMKAASGEAYIDYLKTEIEENTPYDELVRELLTSSGPALERGNGAVNFYLRDRGMPEDNMSNTVRIFLGTRLECAQCHNHPFDKWTQRQYFEMVAFTGGLQYKDTEYAKSDVAQHVREIEKTMKGGSGPTQQAKSFNKMMQPLGYGIHGTGAGATRLPHDYKYPDAKPEQAVTAKAMFGDAVNLTPAQLPPAPAGKAKKKTPARASGAGVGSREAYAEWLTSAKNPRFATVIANRMWKRVMGLGLIEPVDDLKEDTVASNPKLMDYLRNLMVDVGFDLKQYLRTVCNTRAYQREAVRGDLAEGEPFHFQGPLLRRMSAEQIWDSLLTLVVPGLDETLEGAGGPEAERVYREYEELSHLTKDELQAMATDGKKKGMAALKSEDAATQELARKLARAKKKGDEAEVARLTKEIESKSGKPLLMPAGKKGKRAGADKDLVRASDLAQPAKPGHLVREFGQGDREQIETSHKDPAVPQVLTLLNGFTERRVTSNPKAALLVAISSARTPEEKVAAAYLGVLGRPPTAKDKALWIPEISAQESTAVKDMVWTLLNTHEFMFIQ